ncbi:MAG: TrmH family RNA methyltransferase, partial [Candidatus Korobacteraceae bacterium]
SLADAVADCTLVVGTTAVRHRELQHPLKRPEYGARAIRKHLASGRAALVFGTEKFGLSTKDLSHCHWLMHIPTRKGHISMNLGQAVAVCLYELSRDSKVAQQPERVKRATAGEVERVTAVLLEALRESGYVNPHAEVLTEDKVRRLVRRLSLQAGDAELWLGMLRQILWKIRSGGKQP